LVPSKAKVGLLQLKVIISSAAAGIQTLDARLIIRSFPTSLMDRWHCASTCLISEVRQRFPGTFLVLL
jgi:hypothetical protein